ncbi:MAG: EAL domain-containing protein [Treponema sp.]|nr:EAL domain-containing protein [Treponema sp.]
MNYNVWFDVCALIIDSALIISFLLRRYMNILQNKIFLAIIIIMWLASLFSLLTIVLEGKSAVLVEITNYLVILFDAAEGVLWILYAMDLINFRGKKHIMRATIITPIVATVVLLAANYFTGILFTIDRYRKIYVGGKYMFLLYVFVYVHCVAVVVNISMSHRRFISHERAVVVPLMMIIALTGIAVELLFPKLVVQQFVLVILCAITFFTLQNPDEFVDDDQGLLNEMGFVALCSRRMQGKVPMYCIALCVHDINTLIEHVGSDRKNYLEKRIFEEFRTYAKKSLMFKFSEGNYLVVVNGSREEFARKVLENIMRGMQNTKVPFTCCLFECPKYATTVMGIRSILAAVMQEGMEKNISSVSPENLDLYQESYLREIEHLVRTAVTENRLEVYYQPIYFSDEHTFNCAEALVRMKNDSGAFIPPEVFIPIAERSGCIIEIGQFVLEEVCKTLSEKQFESYGIQNIQMNLSVAECLQTNLVENISAMLHKYNVEPALINLEITETASDTMDSIVDKNIQRLHDMGINFSLDDFGTGYSSLNRILSLPLSVIKLNRSIVIPAFSGGNKKAMLLLESQIDMVRRIGCKVVAEGVETEEIAVGISILGCDGIQGFYYARPMPKAAFLKFIER